MNNTELKTFLKLKNPTGYFPEDMECIDINDITILIDAKRKHEILQIGRFEFYGKTKINDMVIDFRDVKIEIGKKYNISGKYIILPCENKDMNYNVWTCLVDLIHD